MGIKRGKLTGGIGGQIQYQIERDRRRNKKTLSDATSGKRLEYTRRSLIYSTCPPGETNVVRYRRLLFGTVLCTYYTVRLCMY